MKWIAKLRIVFNLARDKTIATSMKGAAILYIADISSYEETKIIVIFD